MELEISYWYGLPIDFVSFDRVREIADAGFTVLEVRYDLETNRRVLKYAEALGLHVNVYDERMGQALNQAEGWETALEEMVRDYADCPALLRWFVTDEPTDDRFPLLGRIAEVMRRLDPDHAVFINLLPNVALGYGWPDQPTEFSDSLPMRFPVAGAKRYEAHLDAFLDTVKPRILSYDHYSFKKLPLSSDALPERFYEAAVSPECRARNHTESVIYEAYDEPWYLDNLEIVRNRALSRGIRWINTILLSEHWHYRYLSEQELRYEVFSSLAYGVDGICYFTYWTPGRTHGEPWSYHHGIIEANGEKSERYFWVKNLNREIKAHSEGMGGDTVQSVSVFGECEDAYVSPAQSELFSTSDPVILSQISGGKWMLTNRNHRGESVVSLKTAEQVYHFSRDRRTWDLLPAADTYTLRIAAGDGSLYRIASSVKS